LSDARSKSFSFASVATATQIILATLPLYSQNATWRSSTANTDFTSGVKILKMDPVVINDVQVCLYLNSQYSLVLSLCSSKGVPPIV
jgi:hypothetical protein